MNKVCFGSVIYTSAIKFADDFLRSLEAQTNRDFTLLLVNDDVDEKELMGLLNRYNIKNKIVSYQEQLSPAELRIRLLLEAKKDGVDYLVLGDIDDYFSVNRVETCVENLDRQKKISFVYNDLYESNGDRIMPELPLEVGDYGDILNHNYLGLSNTALNLSHLSFDFLDSLHGIKTHVFDWYLFSRLLLNGAEGRFVNDTCTYYRFHENNFVGMPSNTADLLEKELQVKEEHYKLLSKFSDNYMLMYKAYFDRNYRLNSAQRLYYWWDLTRGNI
nr:glycosyltransferase family A protein [uncultured Butyrivibrio sp.]